MPHPRGTLRGAASWKPHVQGHVTARRMWTKRATLVAILIAAWGVGLVGRFHCRSRHLSSTFALERGLVVITRGDAAVELVGSNEWVPRITYGRSRWRPSWGSSSVFSPDDVLLVTIPVPIPLMAASSMGLWFAVFKRRRNSKKRPTICGNCGYDLTGLCSGKCPECGAERVPASPVP